MNIVGRNDSCPCGSGKKYKVCCINKEISQDELYHFVQRGYDFTLENRPISACDEWLKAFAIVKQLVPSEVKSVREADKQFSDLSESLMQWFLDLEMELEKAGKLDSTYYEKLIQFVDDFCDTFPECEDFLIVTMKIGKGTAYFGLGNPEKGNQAFEEAMKEYPEFVDIYTDWGDMYSLFRLHENVPLDKEKGEQIYRLGLDVELNEGEEGKQLLLLRIDGLRE